jgi:hypothetical protein
MNPEVTIHPASNAEARYRKALLRIIELGERHVEEAAGKRLFDFREAIRIASEALSDDRESLGNKP